jgi:hypothetical protein
MNSASWNTAGWETRPTAHAGCASVFAHDIARGTHAQGMANLQVDRLGNQMHRTVRGNELRAGRMQAADVVEALSRRGG